jgi:NAD(P)-dependent dehydrogenase (short-subunit alcohol dehydrogenase family)
MCPIITSLSTKDVGSEQWTYHYDWFGSWCVLLPLLSFGMSYVMALRCPTQQQIGVRPIPHMVHYSVSKTAVAGLTRGLAELTKGTKVTVNNMLAGPTMTDGVRSYIHPLYLSSQPSNSQVLVVT